MSKVKTSEILVHWINTPDKECMRNDPQMYPAETYYPHVVTCPQCLQQIKKALRIASNEL